MTEVARFERTPHPVEFDTCTTRRTFCATKFVEREGRPQRAPFFFHHMVGPELGFQLSR
jgi:hypothetical protein